MTQVLDDLRVVGGQCDCHLFENPSTGLSRGIFWSVGVDFEDLVFDKQTWRTSLQVEWLTWSIRNWKDLGRCTLGNVDRPELVESTIYLGGIHQSFHLDDLSLEHLGKGDFKLSVLGTFSVPDPLGNAHGPLGKSFEANIRFTGAIVVPENLFPKPSTVTAATAELNAFLDVATFDTPSWDRFRFVFPPRGAA